MCLLPEGENVKFSGNRLKCNRCRGREYYSRNRDKVNKSARAHYAKNRDRRRAWAAQYHRDNPDKKLEWGLRRRYGITLDEYRQMCDAQDNRCVICQEVPRGRLCVDHCHASGKFRGLICSTCNIGLGMFKNDPYLLRRAAGYLR